MTHRLSVDPDRSLQATLSYPSSQSIEESGLPGTAGPHDRHHLALRRLPRDIVQEVGLLLDPDPVFLLLLDDAVGQVVELEGVAGDRLDRRWPHVLGLVRVHEALEALVRIQPIKLRHCSG